MFARMVLYVAFAVSIASPALAARTVTFANYDAWKIYASFDNANQFSYCAASSTYQSGTHFSIIYYRNRAEWVLQFYHNGWPERTGNTPVRLQVDGRGITSGNARFFKRSVFVDLGPSVDRVIALMRGNKLSVITPSGTSAFSLKGSHGATVRVARCLKAYMTQGAGTTAGAFAPAPSANQGAFATAPQAVPQQPSQSASTGKSLKLPRGETLEVALNYLNQNKVGYKLLPAESNFFKNFPVNWSYGPKSYGGMMVIKNPDRSSADQLGLLLGDQARLCTDKSASSRGPVSTTDKSVIHRATGACSASGQQYALHYTVIDLKSPPSHVLIVEMINAGDVGTSPSIGGEKRWRIEGVETPGEAPGQQADGP